MIPPSKIKVGSSVYSCEIVDEFPRSEDYDGHYGMTNVVTERILVSANQSEGQLKDTVLHEALHAIINRSGWRPSDNDEEKLVATISPWLLLVLQDNPKLVAYLTEKVK